MNNINKLIKIIACFCILCLVPACLDAHGRGSGGRGHMNSPRVRGGAPSHVYVTPQPQRGESVPWGYTITSSHSDWFPNPGLRLDLEVLYTQIDDPIDDSNRNFETNYALDPATIEQLEEMAKQQGLYKSSNE